MVKASVLLSVCAQKGKKVVAQDDDLKRPIISAYRILY